MAVGVSTVLVICGRLSQGTADRTPHITYSICREAVHIQPRRPGDQSGTVPFWLKVCGAEFALTVEQAFDRLQ